MDYYMQSQVLVMNRIFPLGDHRLEQLKANGVKIVVDLDDYWELPKEHPNYWQYKNQAARLIVKSLRSADMVTVTTNRLYEKVKPYNSNVHVIPNAIPFGQGQFTPRPPKENDAFNFVYTGQTSHLEDIKLLERVMYKIRSIPGTSFTLAGWSNNKVFKEMESVFKGLPNYSRIEHLPLNNYMSAYDKADCSLIPLRNNEFNWHKSNLKILEAAAKKIPVIASEVPPYSDEDPPGVCWVGYPMEWVEHIKFFKENPNAAVEMGEELYEWAFENYNLDHWNKVRFQLYESLVK